MTLSRRNFLRLGSLAAVAASASACTVAGREIAQAELPETLFAPVAGTAVSPARRFLNRAGYGPRPGDLERLNEMGLPTYLEEQLHPAEIEDTALDVMLRGLTLYHMDLSQLIEQEPRDGVVELIGSTLTRALYSRRQLYEAMVEFWSDHFNIYLRKSQRMPLLKLADDRDVIRPHALGKFRDLLFASAQSPAMLVYLDNVRNTKDEPNENYARELLELHTLGVHAGYTQADVQAVARILTGRHVGRRGRRTGTIIFQEEAHDFSAKVVLDKTIEADSPEAELNQLLELLVTQPATAQFIAGKLVRRFVADEPPVELVDEVAATYLATDGDIKSMLRTIFLSDHFAQAPPKLKRPFTYLVSVLRALHSDLRQTRERPLGRILEQMGQLPFHWPPPNGYPDQAAAWAANLLPRWNFALALLHDEIPGVRAPLEQLVEAGQARSATEVLDLFAGLVVGRPLSSAEAGLFQTYTGDADLSDAETRLRLRDSVALMLAGPAFQWT